MREKNEQNPDRLYQSDSDQRQPTPDTSGPKGTGWRPSGQPSVQPSVQEPHVPQKPVSTIPPTAHPQPTRSAGRIVLAAVLGVVIVIMSILLLFVVRDLFMGYIVAEEALFGIIVLVIDVLAISGLKRLGVGGAQGLLAGEARGIQSRQETDISGTSWTVLSFVLERYDRDGNRITPVPVEMRGRSFTGFLNEGDWVEVHAKLKKGKALRVSQVYNKTTESTVKAKGESAAVKVGTGVVTIIVLAIMIPVILLIIAFVWSLISGY